MAYSDDQCPCGGKKDRDTLLCATCTEQFEDTAEMRTFRDPEASTPFKRAAAIRLLQLSRRRKRLLPLHYTA